MLHYFYLVGSLVAATIDLRAVEDLPTPSLVAGQVAFATKGLFTVKIVSTKVIRNPTCNS